MLKLLVPAMVTVFAVVSGADAMPIEGVGTPSSLATSPDVTWVFDGCGPYGHRGPYGHCRPGGQAGGYIHGLSCPPGFHIGPYGRHCWPN